MFDEMAGLKKSYINTFKSEISQFRIKQRFAHTQDEVILDRLGSFAGTSNYNQEKGGFIEFLISEDEITDYIKTITKNTYNVITSYSIHYTKLYEGIMIW